MSPKIRKKPKLDVEKSFKLLVESAFDFLKKALELFDSDPKRSVIEYYLGLELFFKARLMKEHWTLVAERPGEVNLEEFLNGNAKTVYLEAAKKRLENVSGESFSKAAYDCFMSIGRHRNKMVHFYHEALFDVKARQSLAAEQIRGWHYLNHLLSVQWKAHFDDFSTEIGELNTKIHERKDFLKGKFESLKEDIEKRTHEGSHFEECPSCSFVALEIRPEGEETILHCKCLVCGQPETIAFLHCNHCEKKVFLFAEETECPDCHEEIDPAEELSDHSWHPDDDCHVADCTECGEFESVRSKKDGDGYICIKCFATFDQLHQCEFCGAYMTEENEDSYLEGCETCDGLYGHTKDD